ncbi:MAG: hypothetical protein H6807_15935 [Planctomycetes bacterium]|nr:hypothetical protein [Planctomycetota bacterium]
MRDDLPRLGLSTYWNGVRQPDLGAAVDEIVGLGLGLVELGLPEGPAAVDRAASALDRHRARCHGVYLAPPDLERFLQPHLLQIDDQLRERAERQLDRAIAAAARLRSPRVALAPGSLPVEFEDQRLAELDQALVAGDRPRAHELAATLVAARDRRREQACEDLCRRFHALGRRHPGLRLVILPRGDPLALPDLESFGWIADELGDLVSIRLDLGELAKREALGLESVESWFEAFESRADAIYLADYHGLGTDLPPGAGVLGERIWALGLSPRLPTILKLDPASSRLTVQEALRRCR